MKKGLVSALCLAMALSLCACGGGSEDGKGGSILGGGEKKTPVMKYSKQISYDTTTGEVSYTLEYKYDEKGREIYYKNVINGEVSEERNVEWKEEGNTSIGTFKYTMDVPEGLDAYMEVKFDGDGNQIENNTYMYGELSKSYLKEYKNGKLAKSEQTTRVLDIESVYIIEYDEHGNAAKVVATQNGEVGTEQEYRYEYDKDGKILKVTNVIVMNGEETAITSEYQYDAKGNMIGSTSDNGTYVEIKCDEDGNIIETKNYNAEGQLTSELIREYY